MNTLAKPQFRDLPQGECAGVPILLKLWDHFDFSFILTQAGINKVSGVPTWMTAFLYVVGLMAHCTSVTKMASMAGVRRRRKNPFDQEGPQQLDGFRVL